MRGEGEKRRPHLYERQGYAIEVIIRSTEVAYAVSVAKLHQQTTDGQIYLLAIQSDADIVRWSSTISGQMRTRSRRCECNLPFSWGKVDVVHLRLVKEGRPCTIHAAS